MRYTAQFKNINNTLYQIDFDVDNGITGSSEIMLSSDPFRVEFNGGENIYEPLKLSNASCSILTSELNYDFFSSKVHDVKVTLTNITSNTVEWVGYSTPSVYSQSWEKENEILEIELIDGLSTLENFEYKQASTTKTTYVSFIDLIVNAVKTTSCYKHIYINKNLFVNGLVGVENLVENLFVHERNFIDSDKNKSWKFILSELMRFLNCTLIAAGDSAYVIDYDYIKNNKTEYTHYFTSDNWLNYSTITENLSHTYTIQSDSFMKSGAKFNLTDTKNKASIEVENNIVSEIIPEFYDEDLLENITFEDGTNSSYYSRTIDDMTYIMRWVRNDKIKELTYFYSSDTKQMELIDNFEFYDSIKLTSNLYFGGTLRQIASYKNDEIPSKLEFTDYVCFKRWYSSNDVVKQQLPMFKYTGETDIALLYDDYYFLINLDVNFDSVFNSYYIYEKPTDVATTGEIQALSNGMYLPAKLQIGNKFWNGTEWTTTDSTFNINFNLDGSTKLYNKWYSVINQTQYFDELDGEGQKIPILKSDYLVGNPIFTIYSPVYPTTTHSIFIGTIWMKNFDFKLTKKSNLLGVQKENTDTVYENVINDEFVNKFDDISLKINTDANKGLCYSSVLLKNNNDDFELLSEVSSFTNSTKKQEYNIIENYVNLYSSPKEQLTLNLKNEFKPYSILNSNGNFYVIDSYSIDYYNNSSELILLKLNNNNT